MANKKHIRVGFRLTNGDAKAIHDASQLTAMSMSELCRKGAIALAELIIKKKGKFKLPVKFK